MFEHSKGTEVFRIASVGNARDGIVCPCQEASLDSGFETTEDFDVGKFARLAAARLGGTHGCSLVRLNLQQNIKNEFRLLVQF